MEKQKNNYKINENLKYIMFLTYIFNIIIVKWQIDRYIIYII